MTLLKINKQNLSKEVNFKQMLKKDQSYHKIFLFKEILKIKEKIFHQ